MDWGILKVLKPILIAHRGNVSGQWPEFENRPDYIDKTLESGYNVEIDVWNDGEGCWFFGHDEPKYSVNIWRYHRIDVWFHAKNIEAAIELKKIGATNYFFQKDEPYSITSSGHIWANLGQIQPGVILVDPEGKTPKEYLHMFAGICTDYPEKYK